MSNLRRKLPRRPSHFRAERSAGHKVPIMLVGLICLLTQQALAEPSAVEIARKQAEQAAPRARIVFGPEQFDEYVGYYQLGPKALATVTREGQHFFAQLSGQPVFEVFPESQAKFFARVVAAQVSFDRDVAGKVTEMVLHQNGRELRAPRIDAALAKKIEFSRGPLRHPMLWTWRVLANITPRFVATNGYGACFSPDGKTVLFSRPTKTQGWELLRVPVSDGGAEKLTTLPLPVAAMQPTWSSKSKLIAFTGKSGDGSLSTWVAQSDGTDAHTLIAAGLSDRMFYPSWYPDGKRLVELDVRNLVIKRVDVAGTAAVALTDRSQVMAGIPSVSPDGRWVAFGGQKNDGQSYNPEESVIWLLSDSGTLKTLEPHPVQGRAPAWSPDGKHVAFESDRGSPDGHYAIFVIGRKGTGLTQVTDYALNARNPVWSSDGHQMVFNATYPGTGGFGIAVVDLPDRL